MDHGPKCKTQTIKYLEDNIGESIHYLSFDDLFSGTMPKKKKMQ